MTASSLYSPYALIICPRILMRIPNEKLLNMLTERSCILNCRLESLAKTVELLCLTCDRFSPYFCTENEVIQWCWTWLFNVNATAYWI